MTLTLDPPRIDEVGAALERVTGELDSLVDAAMWALDDEAIQAGLSQALAVQAGVAELTARLVAEVETRHLATQAGASSTTAWLAITHRLPRARAAGLVATGRAMTPATEVTRRAWAAGSVGTEQALVIAEAVHRLPADLNAATVDSAQGDLIGHAQQLNFEQLRQVANHLVEVLDPDGTDAALSVKLRAEHDRAWQTTELRLTRTGDGTHRLSGRLPDLHAAMFRAALDACAAPRRNAACRTGTPTGDGTSPVFDVDGDHTTTEIGLLTRGQRYGRAFCEILEHLPVEQLPSHGVANATVVITMTRQELIAGLGDATLDTGDALTGGDARRLACNASLIPAVLDGPSRLLDLGMARRLFDRNQRLALALRDKGCIWPGCDRPPNWCEAHHLTPWAQGGATDLNNGVLLCGFHHRLLHQDSAGWHIRLTPDGIAELIPPPRIDPTQKPQRHTRYQQIPMRT